MKKSEALKILREAYYWSLNAQVTVWSDFVKIAHTDNFGTGEFETHPKIDFENYGYHEFVLFSKCLSLFEDRGYQEVTDLIDYLTQSRPEYLN